MSRTIVSLVSLIVLLRSPFCLAQVPGATPSPVAATFAFSISNFAPDPVRPLVYGTEPAKNRVIVFKTNPLAFLKAIPVGASPHHLAISADGSRLFVANSGEKSISVIGLETLTALAKWPIPYHPWDLEEGLVNRIYMTTFDYIRGDPAPPGYNGSYGTFHLMQIDGNTGRLQKTFGNTFGPEGKALLEISKDRRTLYWGGDDFATFTAKIDVSTETPGPLQFFNFGGRTLKLSRVHQWLSNSKAYIDVANLNGPKHAFATDLFPWAFAWSGDESIAFIGGGDLLYSRRIDIQSPRTLKTLNSIYINGSNGAGEQLLDLGVDHLGKYLFAACASTVRIYGLSPKLEGYEPVLGSLQSKLEYQVFLNFDATVFSAVSLPPGLRINSGTGAITGTPTQPGSFRATITASRAAVRVQRSLQFQIDRSRLLNLSTRAYCQPGQNTLIGGFIIQGILPKTVAIRLLGPSLSALGVGAPMPAPSFALLDNRGIPTFGNNWDGGVEQMADRVRALGLTPPDAREPALVFSLNPGSYTVVVGGRFGGLSSGTVLLEIYDVDDTAASRLVNISSRAYAGTNGLQVIAGLIVRAPQNGKLLIRAIGPSLSASHIAPYLHDPNLALHDGQGALMATNDNWRDAQQAAIQSTGLAPPNNYEAALLVNLPTGNYTAILRGKTITDIGIALIEIYKLP